MPLKSSNSLDLIIYNEHNRKPTKQELMDIAADMVGGKSNIEFWAVNDAQYAKEAEKVGL